MNVEDEEKQWYVVHTYAGSEERVQKNLNQRIRSMGAEGISEGLIPTEDEVEVHEGKRRTVEKKIFPGYILVEMKMDDLNWNIVRNTPGVTGFVGTENDPTPLSPEEVETIKRRIESKIPHVKTGFSLGQGVRITGGPFVDFLGVIDEISQDKGKAKVLISMFGRETPVELDLLELEGL